MTNEHAITLERQDGSIFTSDMDPILEGMPPLPDCVRPGDTYDPSHSFAFMNDLWQRTVRARQPEIARLTMCERYYRGLHFKNDADNQRLEVTNLCFSNVEVTRAVMMSRPLRPIVEPRRPMDEGRVRIIREAGYWWLDRAEVAAVRYDAAGTKCKYGYSIPLLVVNPETGMPYVINWSPFDWYPDVSARRVEDCEYFFFAAPIATRRLKAMFPKLAEHIVPDNYTSPAYDSTVLPDAALYQNWVGRGSDRVPYMTAPESNVPGNPPTSGTTTMVPDGASSREEGLDTTFLVQLIIRDRSMKRRIAPGTTTVQDPEHGPISFADHHEDMVPVCKSGWRIMWSASGRMLHEEPLDEVFGSVPFAVDYRYRHDHRLQGVGELDNLISINRSINERKNTLNRATAFTGTPAWVTDRNSTVDANRSIEPGDIIEKKPGSGFERLETQQPSTNEFNQIAAEFEHAEIVSGANRSLHGMRPEGIEAGVALRALQGAAAIRIQSSMVQSAAVWAKIVTMACRVMGRKLNHAVFFKATDGQPASFRSIDLEGEYEFRMPDEESDLEAQTKREERYLSLYQMGLLDPGSVLELLEIPNWQILAQRAMQWQLLQKQAEAAAKAQSGAPGKPGDEGSSDGPPQ
ncbi:MAG: hypothetical protein ACKVW3_01910 [Phycisphaerales bacterium]